ncbi:hypothetical protein ACFOHK_02815 [Falsigemmobacter intermedius]|uniref:Uncharacterized protein n=1 Tax=Falsigemmobacter intermedius TaxID=1553448 RepID=A0A444MDB3_9RHOB|nr:hypothetical protein [Falsigemmobacter intermedius]RWY42384.1 hypothetical protein EP867_06515 [Falsigemmobacter intermedius]
MIRPEAQAFLSRWSGVGAALALVLCGLWIGTRGGWLLAGFGIGLALLGAVLARDAFQRLRFSGEADGPGAVEVLEGQIAWFGPSGGGFLALSDLSRVGLKTEGGQRVWLLSDEAGNRLSVPVDAAGAGQLFGALTALPGLDGAKLISALASEEDIVVLWLAESAILLPFRPRL